MSRGEHNDAASPSTWLLLLCSPQRLAMCASSWDAVHACMHACTELRARIGYRWPVVAAGLRGGQVDVHRPDKSSQAFCGCVQDIQS